MQGQQFQRCCRWFGLLVDDESAGCGCKVWSVEGRGKGQSVKCKVQSVKCKVWSVKCVTRVEWKVWSVEYKVWRNIHSFTHYGVRCVQCEM